MNNLKCEKIIKDIKSSKLWDKNYKNLDDFIENGIIKSDKIPSGVKLLSYIIWVGDIAKNEADKFLKKEGLSIPQKNILEALFFSGKEYMTQEQLSKFVYTSKSNLSSLLQRMEKKNLILKKENKNNKRENKICLTKKGEEKIKKIFKKKQKNKILEGFSDEEVQKTIKVLRKMKTYFLEVNSKQ